MSRAYREAKGDILWIIDCNVWVSSSVAGLMVDRLCGFDPMASGRKYKFVHQLPLVVDVSNLSSLSTPPASNGSLDSSTQTNPDPKLLSYSGGLLEALFLSTSHAKFYTAISTVAIAPCTVGKSNMFRRSHLNALTPPFPPLNRAPGIDFFSDNICEDHLIGDLLWHSSVPDSVVKIAKGEGGASATALQSTFSPIMKWANHALLPLPPCIQPLSHLPLHHYLARRTRWLRVRKFTVPLATLVEPGTESLFCTFYGAFGLTTLTWCNTALGIPRTWSAFWLLWLIGVLGWMSIDWLVWKRLQGWDGETATEQTAAANTDGNFSIPPFIGTGRTWSFYRWSGAWLGREILAFPIWAVAIFGGVTVKWRGRTFKVGMDARVREVADGVGNREGRRNGKERID